MWVYSTTTATSAQASSGLTTASGRTENSASAFSSDDYNGLSDSTITGVTTATIRRTSANPFMSSYEEAGWSTFKPIGASSSGMSIQRETHDFTRSETRYTTVDNVGGVTTSSSQSTTSRTRDSYRSTTATTGTIASEVETSTTQTTTRSVLTSAAGPTTASTAQTITRTTSTTQTQAATVTDYLWAPSTTIAAPVSLLQISEAEVTEQAWEITATTYTAGYVSELGSTFTKRTATLTTTSTAMPVSASSTFSTTSVAESSDSATVTLTTSSTLTTSDTFVPHAGVYPATVTQTRQFTLLTTVTTSMLAASWVTDVHTIACNSALFSTALNTFLTYGTITMQLTINVGPTSTATAAMHMTFYTTSALARFRSVARHATSASAAGGDSASEVFDADTTTVTSTSVSTTTTGANTITNTVSETLTSAGFAASQLIVETCGIPPEEDSESFSGEVMPGYTTVEYRTTTHNAPGLHTISVESWYWTTYETTSTETETETPTVSISSFDTIDTTIPMTTSSESASSFTEENGISYTWPRLHSQATIEASVKWTAHQMHPRPGWRHPNELRPSDGLASRMTLSPVTTIFYPYGATQDDSGGACVPLMQTDRICYTTSDSVWSAQWKTSDSCLHWTSAVTGTYTTTQRHGAETVTLTRTSTSATASDAATFGTAGPVSWHAPQSSSSHTKGSRIGGVAAKSEYGAALYCPPGIRHWTHQFDGTSSTSETQWLTGGDLAATMTEGYAMPTRSESVFSVTISETHAPITAASNVLLPLGWIVPLGVGTENAGGVGFKWRPVVTLSLNPNL